jgi:hypothetical protein
MQIFYRVFLCLLLAHLMADFPFQSSWIAANKGKKLTAILMHGAIHVGLSFLILFVLVREIPAWKVAVAALVLALIHLGQDVLKERFGRWLRVGEFSTTAFVIDQALHVVLIALAALLLSGTPASEALRSLAISSTGKDRLLLIAVIYCAVVFGGGYFIRFVTRSLASDAAGATTETSDELRNAGLYIGWLERCLVLTAICMQSPAMVGLIFTGKSIARFPELKDPKFAEYFLIGTLLSVGLALAGGLILLFHFHGTISLK